MVLNRLTMDYIYIYIYIYTHLCVDKVISLFRHSLLIFNIWVIKLKSFIRLNTKQGFVLKLLMYTIFGRTLV